MIKHLLTSLIILFIFPSSVLSQSIEDIIAISEKADSMIESGMGTIIC